MSYLEYNQRSTPSGLFKVVYFHWPLAFFLVAVAGIGVVMLYSNAGGSMTPWAEAQLIRFGIGFALMMLIGFIPIWFWRNMAGVAYIFAMLLLIYVEFFGDVGMGAQRWIDLGFMRLQPSEVMKIALVMILAAYYHWLPLDRVSHPLWVLIPVLLIMLPAFLVLRQPDLGTTLLLIMGGACVMFAAGLSWWYFGVVAAAVGALVTAVFSSRGTTWQLLKDYQYRRIDTFLNPSSDPLDAGWNITQAKIALGSGGWTGRGFMQGTQNRLNFLPEKHTDFIFTTLAEEFGFVGAFTLLLLYGGIIIFCVVAAMRNKNRFASLLTIGVTFTFFLYFAVNIGMVTGLLPVVGVPLPLVSYGGSAMLVLMGAFGLIQSAHIHKPRGPQ